MTEPGLPVGAARGLPKPLPHGQLRIGDVEREAAATALGEHFAAGRLDQEEFDARLSAAYAARTGADVAALFTDLPEPRPAGPRRSPVPAAPRPGLPAVVFVVFVMLFVLPLVAAGAWAAAHGLPPLLLFGLFWVWAGTRRHHRGWR